MKQFFRDNWGTVITLSIIVALISLMISSIISVVNKNAEDNRLREEFAQKYNCRFVGYSAKDQKLYLCDDANTYLWWDFPIKGKVTR